MLDAKATTGVPVSDARGLEAALQAASGGETILLRAGDYGDLRLGGKQFAAPVTLRSEDPDAPASFGTITLISVRNLVIDSVEVDFVPGPATIYMDPAVRFHDVRDVSIVNSVIEGGPAVNGVPPETGSGGLDSTRNVLGLPTGRGVTVQNGENVLIADNDISAFGHGIVMSSSRGITVRGNEVYDLRTTALRGGNLSDIVIDGNHFHNSTPWRYGDADHGDFIHFWTQKTQKDASVNFVIKNNVMTQGLGEAMLGIYIDDDGHGIGFRNVRVEDNVLHNGNRTGIRFENTHDAVIASNTLLQATGTLMDAPGVFLKDKSTNVTVRDNILAHVTVDVGTPRGIRVENNLEPQKADAKLPYYYGALFVNALTDDPEPSDLQAVPGGVIEARGVGAALTRFDDRPERLTAMIRPETDPTDDLQRYFSAELTADAGGLVAAQDATFHWDFGDGNTAKGIAVAHRYAKSGDFPVTLRVTHKDGSVDEARTEADVNGPYLLRLGISPAGVEDQSGYRAAIAGAAAADIVEGPEGFAYRLSDRNDLSLSRHEPQIYGLDAFSLSFAIERESLAAGTTGDIVQVHGSWRLLMEKTGELSFVMTNAEGEFRMTAHGAPIRDTERHAVTLTYDAAAGAATLYIDGQAVSRIAVSGETKPMQHWGLVIGNPHGGNFNGLIDGFEIFDRARSPAEVAELHDRLATFSAPPTRFALEPEYHEAEAPGAAPAGPGESGSGPADAGSADAGQSGSGPAGSADLIDAGGYDDLVGDARIVSRDGRNFVMLDGDGDYIDLGRLEALDADDGIRVAFEFQRSDPGDSGGTLFWNHKKYGLTLAEGRLTVAYADAEVDPGLRYERVGDLIFDDTDWHHVELTIEPGEGALSVVVDGELALHRTGIDLAIDGENGWDATVGGTGWGKQFAGNIDSLTFEVL